MVEKLRPEAAEPGEIVHVDGRVLGRHDGIIRYTIGQRRRLGLDDAGEALYVVRLEPETRRVVVGPRDALAQDRVVLRAVNWLGNAPPSESEAVSVKLRSTSAPIDATAFIAGDGTAEVRLHRPEFGVAPGQACVFYRGDRVLGGGWITRAAVAQPAELAVSA